MRWNWFLLTVVAAIKFDYQLTGHRIRCFSEWVEKDNRYHFSVRANSSKYYVVMNEGDLHHQDNRMAEQYKEYSAFATSSTSLQFCVGSSSEETILTRITFYHGLHLEDNIEPIVEGQQLMQIVERMKQMLELVERNYGIYQETMHSHKAASTRIYLLVSLTIVLVVIISLVATLLATNKLLKYFRYKKLL